MAHRSRVQIPSGSHQLARPLCARTTTTIGCPRWPGTALLFPSLSTGNSNSRNSATVDLDGISLFDDVDFSDKPKEITDCLDDLADLIEEKSVKPMLAAVAPANMMISAASGVPGQQQSTVVRFHGI